MISVFCVILLESVSADILKLRLVIHIIISLFFLQLFQSLRQIKLTIPAPIHLHNKKYDAKLKPINTYEQTLTCQVKRNRNRCTTNESLDFI